MAPLPGLFPPGKGGGEGGARGGKGTGMLLHRLTEGGGMPLAHRTSLVQYHETYCVMDSSSSQA